MTAILGIFASDGCPTDEALVARMLGRMGSRGSARASVWREGGVVIAISRHEWEFGPGFSGPVLIVQDGDHVIAADASLYYRDDLRRKLAARGVRPKGQTPSHLILAAYQAFGEKCPEILEGDFSFVIWDRKARRVVAARDFAGKRPLYYAELNNGRTLVVASSVGAILEHPACPTTLNLFAIGATAANLWAAHDETCYKATKPVAAAHTIVADIHSSIRVQINRHWTPPSFDGGSAVAFDTAAEELRDLLCRATAERLAEVGPTSVWMSGGADSPAVFASGQKVLEQANDGRRLLPISVSYPRGDQGREDELIELIAERWKTPIHWIDSLTIPIFDRPTVRAAERDEPFAHAFEMWIRALAAGCRTVGARIVLDGNGGDQLFYASDYYLSDLLRAGALRTLRSQWRMKRLSGIQNFWALAVQPQIPNPVRAVARNVGLEHLVCNSFNRPLPAWIDRRFASGHGLREREAKGSRKREGETCSAFEARWFLTQQYGPRVFSLLGQLTLENGVESRSPLYDQRVVAFAATRPRSERSSGRRTKQLLGRAMRELLPASVLVPRPFKTGLMGGLFDRGFAAGLPTLSAHAFDQSCRLAALGVVNLTKLRSAVTEYESTHDGMLGISLFLTLQTELWLRTHCADAQQSDLCSPANAPAIFADATSAA